MLVALNRLKRLNVLRHLSLHYFRNGLANDEKSVDFLNEFGARENCVRSSHTVRVLLLRDLGKHAPECGDLLNPLASY